MKPIVVTLTVELSLIIIISSISLSKCDQTTCGNNITTIDLHHLDLSPRSPHYDPYLSHYQRVAKALKRLSALQASKQTPAAAAPNIDDIQGSYVLEYSIGNPPVALKGILDTGSDLIWTPCSSKVSGSTSSKPIACQTTQQCNYYLPGSTTVCSSQGRCSYNMTYGDGSNSTGYLSTDTVTLGSVQFPNITFGCGTNNYFPNGDGDGVVGLGGGTVSLVTQLGYGQFSYCLVSYNSSVTTSKLHLGDNEAVVSGTQISLVIDSNTPTFYQVNLESITVAGVPTIPFRKKMIILDTGTAVTKLPQTFYNNLTRALSASIGTNNTVSDPNGIFGLCYSTQPGNKFPNIMLNFGGNVDVTWKEENVFPKVGLNVWCFAATPIDDNGSQEAIFGNIAQANYLVGFDLNRKTVTIQPKNCGSST